MHDAALVAVAGTAVLWLLSGAAACGLAIALAAGSLTRHRAVWSAARTVVNVTRGVPTSILVIAGGILALRLARPVDLPTVFPGTDAAFQHVGWALVLALAAGSAGHLAEIFRAAYLALGRVRRDELALLGLPRRRRLPLLATETALVALPATGARLVHHLHNTAFAALFPVTELFGAVLAEAHATFRVVETVLWGAGAYVAMSAVVWATFKGAETLLRHGVTAAPPARRVTVT